MPFIPQPSTTPMPYPQPPQAQPQIPESMQYAMQNIASQNQQPLPDDQSGRYGGDFLPMPEIPQSAYDLQYAGAAKAGQADIEAAKVAGSAQQRAASQALKSANMGLNDAQKYRDDFDAEITNLKNLRDEALKEKPIESMGEWFGNKSTVGKVLWGIGLGAATLASMTKAGQAPLGLIMNAIDSDINAQRAKYEQKLKGIATQETLLSKLGDRIGNLNAAQNVTRMQMTDYVTNQVQAAISKTTNERTKGNLLSLLGKLQEQQALNAQKVYADINDRILKSKTSDLQKVPANSATEIADLNAAEASLSRLEDAYLGVKDSKTKQRTGEVASIGAFSGLTQYLPATSAKKYVDQMAPIVQDIARGLEGGKLTDKDVPRYQAMFPQPGDSKDRAEKKFQALRTLIQSKKMERIKALEAAGFNASGLRQTNSSVDNLFVRK